MDQGQLAALDTGRFDVAQLETCVLETAQDRFQTLGTLRVTGPGVVAQGGRVARNYDFHLLTLPQVTSLLRVEGSWPGPLSIKAGWFRARARPWNEAVCGPLVRLDRGGTEFLIGVRDELVGLTGEDVYSPALYPGSTRVWRRAGFEEYATLAVMERSLARLPAEKATHEVRAVEDPDWDAILEVDRVAFEGFWGMSRLGLEEAHETNQNTTLLTVSTTEDPEGFAIVGSQWGVAYLHRIAVHPERTGMGLGAALLEWAMRWGSANGARSMVLNVRADNRRAQALYERSGFTTTGTNLQVLRHAC